MEGGLRTSGCKVYRLGGNYREQRVDGKLATVLIYTFQLAEIAADIDH